MAKTRDWKPMIEMATRLLVERTGKNVASWNRRIGKEKFTDKKSLRNWLTRQGVTGYEVLGWLKKAYGESV